jgi:MFS family permease
MVVMAVSEIAREKLGLPELSGRYSLAGALFTDSLGDGLFVPFAVVYFLHTTGLSLPVAGFGLSAASLLALPAAPVCGVLIDRLAPARVVIIGNLISAAAFAGYLGVGNLWELVLCAFFAATGGRFFWTANLALVGEAFEGPERARWFAFQRAARNAGYGLGGLLAAAALGSGSGIGYRALALANAASFVLAAALVFRWHSATRGDDRAVMSQVAPRPGTTGSYRVPLTDGPFLLLTVMNVLFVLCMMVLDVLLAVYLVRVLHQPVWLSGFLFAANTVAIAAFQTAVWRLFAGRRPVRVLQFSAAVWGASFLLMWLTAALPASFAVAGVTAAVAVYTAAELIQGPVFNGLVVAAAPEHARGRYMAVYQLSWALAQATAPGLFGWLFTTDHALPWIVLAAGCAACVLILAGRAGRAIGSL